MRGDKLFTNYYEPKLIEHNIENVVLRTYTHIRGLTTDDPENSTSIIFTPRDEMDRRMDVIFALSGEEVGMGITSIVGVGAKEKHLLLLDCAAKKTKPNDGALIEVIQSAAHSITALQDAMILRTVESYHVVGFVPLDKQEWQKQMSMSLLLKMPDGEPVMDTRYVGHCLEREYGSLRLSDYKGKPTPDFLCYITTGEDYSYVTGGENQPR